MAFPIPLPWLIAVPVVGALGLVIYYEVEKHKAASAPVAPALPPPPPPPTAAAPVSVSAPVAAAAAAPAPAPASLGPIGLGVRLYTRPAPVPADPRITAVVSQALAALGSPPPSGDIIDSINYQAVHAALTQLQSNPTVAQLGLTMTALQQNKTPTALALYNMLSRVYQTIQA